MLLIIILQIAMMMINFLGFKVTLLLFLMENELL